jgi:hypothetical protein
MRPVFYTDLLLCNTEFEPTLDVYLEWCLGIRRFHKQGERREAAGFNPQWSLKQLLAGATFTGRHDARLLTRAEDGRFLLQFVHRDHENASELWHIVVEVLRDGRGTRVRHAQGRTGPRHMELRPTLGAPAVVRQLLAWNGPNVVPKGIGDGSPIPFTSDEAEDILKYLVLDGDRRCGLVLISPVLDTGLPLVAPTQLARHLAGQARVLVAGDVAASEAYARALRRHGFSDRFGAWDGAVRLYSPGITLDDDPYRHRLWVRDRLESYDPELLIDSLAGEIAERAIQGTIPRGFFTIIERFDREQLDRKSTVLLESSRTAAQNLANQLTVNEQLRAQLEAVQQQISKLEAELKDAQESCEYFAKECDLAQQQREEARVKVTALGHALNSRSNSTSLSDAQHEALTAVVEGHDPTPLQCLRVLEALYSDRVVVLREACESAEERASFRHGRQLLELLLQLATRYWQRMVDGGAGDRVAGEVFGAKFCPLESETTMNNTRAKRERTFALNGSEHVMWRHLRIGVIDSPVEMIRVHFEWLPRERKILIGHCGRHLYLPNH